MEKSQRFCQEERLKSRKAIASLFESGKYINTSSVKLVWQQSNEENPYPVRAAFTASKRNFRRAVDRNYLKRKMREAYRRQKADLYTFLQAKNLHLNIFFVFQGREDISYQKIYESISKLLESLQSSLEA